MQSRSIRELLAEPVKPNDDWIVGLIPRSAKLLYGGEAKIGKSFIGLEICRALASKTPAFGMPQFDVRYDTRVWLLEKELGPDTLQRRSYWTLKGLTADQLDNIHYSSGIPGVKLDDQQSLDRMNLEIARIKPNVIILDPVSKFMKGSDSDNEHVAKLCDGIDKMIERWRHLGLSFVMPHHYGKPSKDRDGKITTDRLNAYEFRGASRWKDDPDVLMTMSRHDIEWSQKKWWLLHAKFESRRGLMPDNTTFQVTPEQDREPIVRALSPFELDTIMPKTGNSKTPAKGFPK